jgi:maltose alpha-D-glucosyltransferase/alpha-amylase
MRLIPAMKKTTGGQDIVGDQATWYKDAIIYELHVRAFCDHDGDGIGDFAGLISKLDYLQDLGVTAIWLLPFYPSPLRDDGYDIAHYTNVHPSYGEMRHFRRFLREAHRRDLKVITELVINHTSTDHAWFQRARRAKPGSVERDFYVWTDNPEKYSETRIIFKDFETSNWAWDPVAGAYYWHRFYSHQPDLNFENPAVQEALFKVLDFWMEMGVDGMRLDAVPYLYEREGTNCENLPETHEFLKRLRRHIDERYADRMLLAEANQWPEDAAAYFGDGDECHMNFHFPLMPRLFMAVQLESSFPIHDILEQTPEIPDSCQWALFLRNHDELTLEMVTDEDRDFMYRVFAADARARVNLGIRRRLVPLLGSRRKVELLNAILLSLPGTPVLYYGDEIGMGDNVYLGDRNGVRTPMQWSADRNAGFSRTNPQRLFLPPITDPEYHYEAINVEAQQANPSSLLWWMKRLMGLRKQSQVFGRGDVQFLRPENSRVLAYVRSYEDDRVLVVANLSRFTQFVELDLSSYQGMVPVEMFGQTEFPSIGTSPYFLTLGPHAFYWFRLMSHPAGWGEQPEDVPTLQANESWHNLLTDRSRLKAAILAYLARQAWFLGRTRKRKSTHIADVVPLGGGEVKLVLFELTYVDGKSETYVLPLAFVAQAELDDQQRAQVIAAVELKGSGAEGVQQGVLIDALGTRPFADGVLELFGRLRRVSGRKGRLSASSFRRTDRLRRMKNGTRSLEVDDTGTHVTVDNRLVIRLHRSLEDGTSPDLEVTRHLSEKVGFANIPPPLGAVDHQRGRGPSSTLIVLQRSVPNQGTAWLLCTEALGRFYEQTLSSAEAQEQLPSGLPRPDGLVKGELPPSCAKRSVRWCRSCDCWRSGQLSFTSRLAAIRRTRLFVRSRRRSCTDGRSTSLRAVVCGSTSSCYAPEAGSYLTINS